MIGTILNNLLPHTARMGKAVLNILMLNSLIISLSTLSDRIFNLLNLIVILHTGKLSITSRRLTKDLLNYLLIYKLKNPLRIFLHLIVHQSIESLLIQRYIPLVEKKQIEEKRTITP